MKVLNEQAHLIDWAEYEYVGEDDVYTYYRPAPTQVR